MKKTRSRKSRDTVPLSKLSTAQSNGKFRERNRNSEIKLLKSPVILQNDGLYSEGQEKTIDCV
jgi:hypothetical protein